METFAITVVGPDRAGIVNELSAAIAAHSGNWLESHMANLAGQFAGIIEVQVATTHAASLARELQGLERNNLQVVVSTANSGLAAPHRRSLVIELLGCDHFGIVRDITTALANSGTTIEMMETECFSASMSGEQMFKAQIQVKVPESLSTDALEDLLQQVSADLMMDMVILPEELEN